MDKAEAFGVRITNAYRYLTKEKQETIISKQLYRSGTSISANISEAQYASSRADFINKMHIALKEANESKNWINLLHKGQFIDKSTYESIYNDVVEIIKLLTSSINTAKNNGKNNDNDKENPC